MLVRMHPSVLTAMADLSLWPRGHAGGGLLLGAMDATGFRVTGAVQLWYRDPQGRVVRATEPGQWQPMVGPVYRVVGSFTVGASAQLSKMMMPGVLPGILKVGLSLEGSEGRIEVTQGGAPLTFELADSLPVLPLRVGSRERPGLGWATGRQLRLPARWLAAGAAVVTIVALVFGAKALFARPVVADDTPLELVAPPLPDPDPQPSPAPDPGPQPTTPSDPAPAAPEPQQNAQPFVYVVQGGDNLNKIALKFYGSEAHTDLIAKTNQMKDDLLQVGQMLIIPPLP